MSQVRIEIRTTGPGTYSGITADGKHGATDTDRTRVVFQILGQVPGEVDDFEVRDIPIPPPSRDGLFVDALGVIKPCTR